MNDYTALIARGRSYGRDWVDYAVDASATITALANVLEAMIAEHSQIRADAWDEGYRKGNLDGYFGTNKEKNPYRRGCRRECE